MAVAQEEQVELEGQEFDPLIEASLGNILNISSVRVMHRKFTGYHKIKGLYRCFMDSAMVNVGYFTLCCKAHEMHNVFLHWCNFRVLPIKIMLDSMSFSDIQL